MVSGDGEGLVDAAGVGLLDGAGVVRYSASYTSADALRRATAAGDVLVVTDENRLRARKWTTVTQTVGFTEQAGAADTPLTTDPGDARLDVFPGEQPSALTTASDVGVQRVVATAYGNTNTYWPENRPVAALDGDLTTAWTTQGFGDARGQRIEVDLNGDITTDHVNLVQPLGGTPNRYITNAVLTFDGAKPVAVALGPQSRTPGGQTVTFPTRTFRTLTIRIVQTNDHRPNLFGQDDPVGFAEIRVRDAHATHDVRAAEVVQMPGDLLGALGGASAGHPLVIVMNRDAIRPVPPRTQPEPAIAREFVLATARAFDLTGNATVSPDAPDAAIETALSPAPARSGLAVSASGFLQGCLECRADAAFDADPHTAWQTPFDQTGGQWAEVDSARAVTVDHLDLSVIADGRHSVPTKLRLDVDGQTRDLTVAPVADRRAPDATVAVPLHFAALTGHKIRITIEGVREERTKLFGTAQTRVEPVGIAGFGLAGVAVASPATGTVDSGCRSDLVAVDGKAVAVRVTGNVTAAQAPMGLAVTPCGGALELTAGTHVVTTAAGKAVGFSLDRLAFASGTPAVAVATANGHVRVAGPAPTPARVAVVHNGDTKMQVHVQGATKPFWLVLGESRSPGWHARVVGGHDLGPSQLVDGYANGWLVTPPASGTFDVVFEWTPQRQVKAAIGLSLLGVLLCLGIIAFTWIRRRGVVATARTPWPGDADVDLAWSGLGATAHPLGHPPGHTIGQRAGPPGAPADTRTRWLAPLVTGLLAALVVAPWVGVLIAAVVFVIVTRPQLRDPVLAVPAVLLALCAVYIVVEQYRYRYPPVFEWPTVFPHARTLAWVAVMLLTADAFVEIRRGRRSPPPPPGGPGAGPGAAPGGSPTRNGDRAPMRTRHNRLCSRSENSQSKSVGGTRSPTRRSRCTPATRWASSGATVRGRPRCCACSRA